MTFTGPRGFAARPASFACRFVCVPVRSEVAFLSGLLATGHHPRPQHRRSHRALDFDLDDETQ
jgi:hypothetical protein